MTSRPQAAVQIGFGPGRELRPLHVQVGATGLYVDTGTTAGVNGDICHFAADRLAKADVHHQAIAEEGVDAMAGSVDELIGHNKVQRMMFFLQRADGGKRQDALHAKLFEAVNVGAIIDLGGHEAMPAPMARQESDFAALQRSQNISIGRRAEWGVQEDIPDIAEARHGV